MTEDEPRSVETIRDTLIGTCIGATILDITTTETEDFLATGENRVFLHLSNGETIYATLGVSGESEGMFGLMGTEDEDED